MPKILTSKLPKEHGTNYLFSINHLMHNALGGDQGPIAKGRECLGDLKLVSPCVQNPI